jgi:NADPH:quinone reductase-like Zn-dependent oxidoreductase
MNRPQSKERDRAMKTVGVTGPDFEPRLFDVEDPTPVADGDVVEVLASSVNDFDRAAAHGYYHSQEAPLTPVFLGRDFVGRVTAVGENVNYIEVGTYVAGAMAPTASGQTGTFTDKVAVAAEMLAPVPDGIDLPRAAGVGLAGVSALDAVDALEITGLEIVAIQGPVTGVGGYALQLAKARGAVVVALTLPEQADLAWELGADVVLPTDLNSKHAVERLRSLFRGGVDSAIHIAGDLSVATEIVRPGGKFTSVSGASPSVGQLYPGFVPTMVAPNGHKLADLLFKVAARRLHSHVTATVSIDQVGDAMSSRNDSSRFVLVR